MRRRLAGRSRTVGTTPIERAQAADLAMLAMDRTGRVPEHLGAVLVLDARPGVDPATVSRVLVERIGGVPRLRQRLVRLPPGCGRPIWTDDPAFDVARHVRFLRCPAPGDEEALLDLAVAVAVEPLPRSRPLWVAVLVTGLAGGRVGLVLMLHHVLADGVGGLAMLSGLLDPGAPAPVPDFPRARPARRRLVAEAARARLGALARIPATGRELRRAVAAVGGRAPVARAAPCSILRPTGSRRRLAVVHADLAALRVAAHRHGGTVNDVLVTVVAGALHALLSRRGESVGEFRVAVMVANGAAGSAEAGGNRAAPLVVGVPGAGPVTERLARFAGTVAAARATATGRPLIAVLQPLFRIAAAVGLYRLYLTHQDRLHTLVSNVRGPDRPLTLAGVPISSLVPVAVGEAGNLTVEFLALSYAGTLTVTVVADPDAVPDLPELVAALQLELDSVTRE